MASYQRLTAAHQYASCGDVLVRFCPPPLPPRFPPCVFPLDLRTRKAFSVTVTACGHREEPTPQCVRVCVPLIQYSLIMTTNAGAKLRLFIWELSLWSTKCQKKTAENDDVAKRYFEFISFKSKDIVFCCTLCAGNLTFATVAILFFF